MVIGIETKNKSYFGECEFTEVCNSYNTTYSVICENYVAKSLDNILCKCDICGKAFKICKRNFVYKKKYEDCFCSKCVSEFTNLKKYGYKSYNQSPDIKRKQQKNNKDYLPGNNHPVIDRSVSLSSKRSKITKEVWKTGKYDLVPLKSSEIHKKLWEDKEYRDKMTKSLNTESCKDKKSCISKKNWERIEYREKMSKIGLRISKFQKNVFSYLDSNVWVMEYPILEDRYTVDICCIKKKIIIECFGDYWHCNPNKYEGDFYHKRVHKTAKDIWNHDNERLKKLRSYGYTVYVIWEKEWNNFGKSLLEKMFIKESK